jgi:hypothetical protein
MPYSSARHANLGGRASRMSLRWRVFQQTISSPHSGDLKSSGEVLENDAILAPVKPVRQYTVHHFLSKST